MIRLGSYDRGVPQEVRNAYLKRVEVITRLKLGDVTEGPDKLKLLEHDPGEQTPMSVAELQRGLQAAGFFPAANVDGICGYRTLSAMRLFQEYVRTREDGSVIPDGRFGPISQKHLKRWVDQQLAPAWNPTIVAWREGSLVDSEYTDWLTLLNRVKEHYAMQPGTMLTKVNAHAGASDTMKVAQWDFAPTGNVHLIGIRRAEKSGKFDDIFVMLIKGLVFKFQGTTEPGASSNPAGAPFLVQGQHDYRYGWHQRRYLALRPARLDKGVLVVRSREDLRLDESDLANALEANATINIHWGGKGLKFDVKNWSEGCQVVNGTMYVDENNALVDCSGFAATNDAEVAANGSKTRAAYNVLADLITALGGDLSGNCVKYMLLCEGDLRLAPKRVENALADARESVRQRLRS